MIARLTNLFWLWTIIGAIFAWFLPKESLLWVKPLITPGLGVIMLGMGLTLTFENFKAVGRCPVAVGVGVIAQFVIMPTLGYFVAKLFGLSPGLAAGLILVCCCPGGTASNVIAFLSRANVALSVLMTMCSTFLAVALTPLMTGWLAGEYVDVDEWTLFKGVLTVVLFPVLTGLMLNQFFPKVVKPLTKFSPLVSVIVIVLIVGYVLAMNKAHIQEEGMILIAAVLSVHSLAFLLGYLFAKLFGCSEDQRRTVSIEVGMQNSGLGVKLAGSLANPLAPVPAAISAICHCLLGSLAAAWWRGRPPSKD